MSYRYIYFKIRWEKDEKQPLAEQCTVENAEGRSSLFIRTCSRDHSGKYTIVCKNAGGTRTASCKVIVKGNEFFNS